MKRAWIVAAAVGFAFAAVGGAWGQTPAAAPDTAGKAVPAGPSPNRASWTSDRTPLRAGDILTVIVDEQTTASEKVSQVATANRGQDAGLSLSLNGSDAIKASAFKTSNNRNSRDDGQANRQGNLSGVLTVRVVDVAANGVARIEGSKKVNVDGRDQEITLKGSIRSEDVSPSNVVLSSRVADAEIGYKGGKIGPRAGILGKILSILWP